MGIQFDKVVSGLIGVHAFTVLGPQVLVLQKMLAAISPTGDPTLHPMPCTGDPYTPQDTCQSLLGPLLMHILNRLQAR